MKTINYLNLFSNKQTPNDFKTKLVNAMNHAWSSISEIPSYLFKLVQRISDFVKQHLKNNMYYFNKKEKNNFIVLKLENSETNIKDIEILFKKNWPKENTRDGATSGKNTGSKTECEDPFADLGAMSSPRRAAYPGDQIVRQNEMIENDVVAEVLAAACKELIKSANELLILPDPDTKERYADLILQFELVMKDISNEYSTTFKNAPTEQAIINAKLKELRAKANELSTVFCAYIRSTHKSNKNIPDEGSCFYWSIRAEIEQKHTPDKQKNRREMQIYREMTGDYISKNKEKYSNLLIPELLDPGTLAEIKRFIGLPEEELRKASPELFIGCYTALIRDPNSDMYATDLEVSALSSVLEQPMLIFRPNEQKKGGLILSIKGEEFVRKGKPPIYLYYNGINHYQNIIPK